MASADTAGATAPGVERHPAASAMGTIRRKKGNDQGSDRRLESDICWQRIVGRRVTQEPVDSGALEFWYK